MNQLTKNLFLCIVICSFLNINAQQNPPKLPEQMSFNFSPSINVTPEFSQQHIIENNPAVIVHTLSYSVGMQIKDVSFAYIAELYNNATRDNYSLIKNTIQQTLKKYRYRIAAGILTAAYGITYALLTTDYHYLNNSAVWSHWKEELSFEQLCSIPQKDLAQQLALSIGQHYYNKNNPTNIEHPLIEFIKAIETEIRVIKRYMAVTRLINRLHLYKIFPINDTKIGYVHTLLDRTLFIKHVFLSWLSEYNLGNNTL